MYSLHARTCVREQRRFYHSGGSVSVDRLDGERMQDGQRGTEEAEHTEHAQVLPRGRQGEVPIGDVDKARAAAEREETVLGVDHFYRASLHRIVAEARPE